MRKKQEEKIFNNLKKNAKGITLIALVVTIIVLLILAGVAIMLTVGENGLFKRAENATKEYDMASVKEELVLMLGNMEIDNAFTGISKEDIAKELEKNGATINDVTDDEIEGEYKDYEFTIDEDNNVIIGGKLTGEKPTGVAKIITEGEDLEEVEIKVTAQVSDGTIESITALNGAELTENEQNTDSVKIFKVKENGTFRFKIRASNRRTAIVSCQVESLVELIKEVDTLTAVKNMNSGGKKKVQVTGKISDGTETTETYSMNVIYHKGDMVLDGSTTYDGGTLIESSKTYEFGNVEKDVATASTDAQNTVVLKVEGNLTINENVTLTTVKDANGYGGPKGMIIECTGILTNNGTISMTARGAKAEGQNLYLYKNADGSFEYVSAIGGTGGAAVTGSRSGLKGGDGINRACAGGGSGANGEQRPSGAGGNGTSYAGGGGGGGARYRFDPPGGNAVLYKGGNAGYCANSGAGIPAGVPSPQKPGYARGQNGSGGLLVIQASSVMGNGKFEACRM